MRSAPLPGAGACRGGSWQCLRVGEALQSSEPVWSGLQSHWREPLLRQAPEQWRCAALAGSTRVRFASGG
ncbi:protein of unknown function [Methylorubrum extorquens DM4]|uniref:Uncharacterized protein n=1 Tax=Methylorubrum extorquens (strain DSM 6343 / CIP 106787 / DM4) TaxID=661410 RepID=C7C818_METED|nr:protein of unknown function [Methylorubrum extorquens DM4]